MKKVIILFLIMLAAAAAQTSINVKKLNNIRFADQYSAGSNTGGIAEAYADCPATGCTVMLGMDIVISSSQTITIADNKNLVLNLSGHTITVANGTGIGLTFTDNNINLRTPFLMQNGTLACSWTNNSLTGFKFSAMTNVRLDNINVLNCNHSGFAMLWDDVEDASITKSGFRFNDNALKFMNATNDVELNAKFDSNINAFIVQDFASVTVRDSLFQSNTGTRAVQVLTTAANNATTIKFINNHFENNGDSTANARNLYIAPATSQVITTLMLIGNTFSRGAFAATGKGIEIAGSQNVQPIISIDNQYNGYTVATDAWTGVTNTNRVTSIGENGGILPCDVCLNSTMTGSNPSGLYFNPANSSRQFQIFTGWTSNFNGFLQFWDLTGNASILAYNSGSNQWQFNKDAFMMAGHSIEALDNSGNAQFLLDGSTGILHQYHNWTDASNYERLLSGYSTGDSAFKVATAKLGTGTDRALIVGTSGAAPLIFETNGTLQWQVDSNGNLETALDNTVDIGLVSSQRPRTIRAATSVVTPVLSQTGTDTASLITSFNSSASSAAQFVLKHNFTDVEFDSLRGGFIFTPNSGTNRFALGIQTTSGVVDFLASSHTLPIKSGTTAGKPATCTFTAGAAMEIYLATDATPGQNMFFCTATNTWTQQLNTGISTTYQVNAVNLTSSTTINWQNGANITVTNPSAGNVAFDLTGTIPAGRFPAFTGDCTTSAGFVALTCGAAIGRTGNPLSQFASTTSLQLAGVLSDETGTGVAVFSASPTLTGTLTAANITATGAIDFSGGTHTSPFKVGTVSAKPATCTTGELYFATDATAGQQIYECSSTNTWTQQLSGGGGNSFSTITVTGGAGTLATFTGGATTSTNNLINCTDTTSNTGTGYCMSIASASSSALNGLKINRGASGTGTKAISVQNNSTENFSVDFLGNLIANSLTFNTLATSTLNDANGNAFLKASATASAVDGLTITNAAAANPATVKLGASGSDSNINFEIDAKGSGKIQVGSTAFTVDSTGNLVTTGTITAQGYTSSVAAPVQIPTGTAAGALANTITIASDTGDVPKVARGGGLFIELADISSAQTFTNKAIAYNLTATASLTAGQVVKIDTATNNAVVVATTTDTAADVTIGFVINSPGASGTAQVVTSGVITSPILGTGTCSRNDFVFVDTTTNGRVKCSSTLTTRGTSLGRALTAQASVGSTVTVLVDAR
jgi:hypothetical protein